jgi:hypothetical protein
MTKRPTSPRHNAHRRGKVPAPKKDELSTALLSLVVDCMRSDGTDEGALRARIAATECGTLDDVLRLTLWRLRERLSLRSLTIEMLREFVDPDTNALALVAGIDDEKLDLFVAFQEFVAHDLIRARDWEVVVPIAHCPTTHGWKHRRTSTNSSAPRLDCVTDESGTWLVLRSTLAETRPAHVEERAFAVADQLVGLLIAVRLLERRDAAVDETAVAEKLPPPLRYTTDDDPSPDDRVPHFRNTSALGGARAAAIRGTRPCNLAAVGLVDRLNGRTPVDDPDTLVDRVLSLLGSDAGRAHQIRTVAALYGRAIRHDDPRERAFYLGSALEALLLQDFSDGGERTPRVTERIGAHLSDGVVALLGHNEGERARLKKLTKALYDERSRFAHGPGDGKERRTDGAGDELVRVLLERAILGDDAGS